MISSIRDEQFHIISKMISIEVTIYHLPAILSDIYQLNINIMVNNNITIYQYPFCMYISLLGPLV